MRRFAVILLLVGVSAGLALAYVFWGYGWKGVAGNDLSLHKTELSAAYSGFSSRVPAEATGVILRGQEVDVLYDLYGKDYWACYIRTADGRFGWVLCTDLQD